MLQAAVGTFAWRDSAVVVAGPFLGLCRKPGG